MHGSFTSLVSNFNSCSFLHNAVSFEELVGAGWEALGQVLLLGQSTRWRLGADLAALIVRAFYKDSLNPYTELLGSEVKHGFRAPPLF